MFTVGKKTVQSVSSTFVQFKWNHYTHRIYALRMHDPKYMRLRSPKLIERWTKLRRIVNDFMTLSDADQLTDLWHTCVELGKLGAAEPL